MQVSNGLRGKNWYSIDSSRSCVDGINAHSRILGILWHPHGHVEALKGELFRVFELRRKAGIQYQNKEDDARDLRTSRKREIPACTQQ